MLLQSAAMVAKKLLVDDKITAQSCPKQICIFGLICKIWSKKTLSGEQFAFLRNVCYQYFLINFVLRATYCFLTIC